MNKVQAFQLVLIDTINKVHETPQDVEAISAQVINDYFTDDVLAEVEVETYGHDTLDDVMNLEALDKKLRSLKPNRDHGLSYSRVRESLQNQLVGLLKIFSSTRYAKRSDTISDDQAIALFSNTCRLENRQCECCAERVNLVFDIVAGKIQPAVAFNIVAGETDSVTTIDFNKCPGKDLKPETFEFNAPSGKIVIANDLRILTPSDRDEVDFQLRLNMADTESQYYVARGINEVTVNCYLGQRANRDYYLNEHQMVYLQADDGACGIFAGEGYLKIGEYLDPDEYNDEDTDEVTHSDKDSQMNFPKVNQEEMVGDLSTSLLAVHIMDHDVFCKKAKALGYEPTELMMELGAFTFHAPSENMLITDYFTMPEDVDRDGLEDGVIAMIKKAPEPEIAPATSNFGM